MECGRCCVVWKTLAVSLAVTFMFFLLRICSAFVFYRFCLLSASATACLLPPLLVSSCPIHCSSSSEKKFIFLLPFYFFLPAWSYLTTLSSSLPSGILRNTVRSCVLLGMVLCHVCCRHCFDGGVNVVVELGFAARTTPLYSTRELSPSIVIVLVRAHDRHSILHGCRLECRLARRWLRMMASS